MDFHGKRLLVLGGAAQCLKVIEAAKEMGVYTIVTDIAMHGPAKLAADEALPFSVMDAEGIICWCKDHPVDGVINYCVDYAQKTHQKICSALGLPCYGTEEQYRYLTDKQLFKKLCVENNVGVIPEYDADDPDGMEFPVLVKPAESSGSRGSAVCRNAREVAFAMKAASEESRNGKVIIEKYMYGCPDFSMTYSVIDGEPHLIRTLDRFVGRPEDNLQRQCICARCPSVYTDLYLEKAHANVVAMLKKLGLRNAAVFMQGFIDGDVFRFYDPGIRFSGSEYERMLKEATGVDPVKAYIGYALGGSLTALAGELKDVFLLNGKCGLQLFIDAYPGTMDAVIGADDVAGLPGVVAVIQKHSAGYVVPDSRDLKQRLFEIVTLTANDKQSVVDCIDSISRTLSIKDPSGRELMTPLIDIKRLFK